MNSSEALGIVSKARETVASGSTDELKQAVNQLCEVVEAAVDAIRQYQAAEELMYMATGLMVPDDVVSDYIGAREGAVEGACSCAECSEDSEESESEDSEPNKILN